MEEKNSRSNFGRQARSLCWFIFLPDFFRFAATGTRVSGSNRAVGLNMSYSIL